MDKLRSLYNDWEVSTDEASDIYREVSSLLQPIFERSVTNNLRIREVAQQMRCAVDELEAFHCLMRNSAAYKRGGRPSET